MGSALGYRVALSALVLSASTAQCGRQVPPGQAASYPANPANGSGGSAASATEPAVSTPTTPQAAPLPGTLVELGGRTKLGKYRVVLRFVVPKVSELFVAELTINGADGAELPVAATVILDAAMPEHHHGMMTQPQTRSVAASNWQTDGLKLHMQGHWVFTVEVHGGAGVDRLELPFEQPPEALTQ
ncbi:MAG: hypothetical protein EXR77_07965 [Myxococcales bacterium]|nr:hypothetical protein [Myxococcales bacterium]